MIVYIDTGGFIDYLSQVGHNSDLRTASRGSRSPSQLYTDADKVLRTCASKHQACTSAVTLYEAEEALYKTLKKVVSGAPKSPYLVLAARSIVYQTIVACQTFSVSIVDLSSATIMRQLQDHAIQQAGIRAADALHLMTAIMQGAELFISTDGALHALDKTLVNCNGQVMRIVDTDQALTLL
jgi:predicted nucleic acid-binding protein